MKCSMKKADSRQKGRTKGEETPISAMVTLEKDREGERLDGYIYVLIQERKCVTAKWGQAMDSGQRRTSLCIFALLHYKDRKQPWQWKDGARIDGLTVQTCITAARTDED